MCILDSEYTLSYIDSALIRAVYSIPTIPIPYIDIDNDNDIDLIYAYPSSDIHRIIPVCALNPVYTRINQPFLQISHFGRGWLVGLNFNLSLSLSLELTYAHFH